MEEIGAVLTKIDEAINAIVQPDQDKLVAGIVFRGKKIMYSESTHGKVFEDISKMDMESDPQKLAMAVAGLLTLIRTQNGDGFQDEAMVPGTCLLMVDMLQFMSESGAVEPTTEFVGNCFEELLSIMMQKVGIGPEELDAMNADEQTIKTTDPTKLPEEMPPEAPPQPPQGLIDQAAAVPQ